MIEETYNIKDLEKLTGIKAHTIRIWEKRYKLLTPRRTETNIRYYTSEDLKKLLNISILNKNGYKISKITELTADEINDKVIELTTRNSDVEDQIQTLTMAMFDMNFQKFEKQITISYINRGFESTYEDIIIPFLTKVGFLWQTGTISPAQEHFASSIITRKIMVAIDGLLASYNDKSNKILMFLPENEVHEMSLLYGYYLLKKHNHKVTYLGPNSPINSIDQINSFQSFNYLIVSFTTSYSGDKAKAYLENLSNTFPNQKILVIGGQLNLDYNRLPDNIQHCKQPSELLELI